MHDWRVLTVQVVDAERDVQRDFAPLAFPPVENMTNPTSLIRIDRSSYADADKFVGLLATSDLCSHTTYLLKLLTMRPSTILQQPGTLLK